MVMLVLTRLTRCSLDLVSVLQRSTFDTRKGIENGARQSMLVRRQIPDLVGGQVTRDGDVDGGENNNRPRQRHLPYHLPVSTTRPADSTIGHTPIRQPTKQRLKPPKNPLY